jgi:hypothetical protein
MVGDCNRSWRASTGKLAMLVLAAIGSSTALAQVEEAPPPTPTEAPPAAEQKEEEEKPATRLEIYGFAMTDIGYDFGQVDPAWFDVLRPTKLPSFDDEFGKDGETYAGVRQSRFGVKSFTPTDLGELKTTFEFEMFGVGVDAGQTTIRLRHAYGELGQFGAGQYWSPFMDIDVFPNSVEYWGPPGMAFFRNVQVRWMPIQGDTRATIALERPGASGDAGVYTDRVELEDVAPRFPAPDLSGEFRYGGGWGYVELAGILRWIEWDDLGMQPFDLAGEELGWGLNLSSNLKLFGKVVLRLSALYGEGVENYLNDAPADIGIENTGDPTDPVDGVALPVLGLVGFADITWSPRWTTSAGYSLVQIDNSSGQSPDAFQRGHYALANLLFSPVKNVMMGAEFQYGRRVNNSDGFTFDDYRLQFSFKYSFSLEVGGEK